jgi:hypothetical protein
MTATVSVPSATAIDIIATRLRVEAIAVILRFSW